jgi:uncharacterized protein YegL
MNNKKTIYHFIVDESVSMSSLKNETIEGFNTQLKTIKELKEELPENEFIVSVTYFNNLVKEVIKFGKIEDIPLLSPEIYHPDSCTSLLDAIGQSIDNIQNHFGYEIEENLATVVLIILTDGKENSSRYYNYFQISERIEILSATDKWVFTFLGAGLDVSTMTERMKMPSKNVTSFDKSRYSEMLDRVSRSVRNYEKNKSADLYSSDFLMDDEE